MLFRSISISEFLKKASIIRFAFDTLGNENLKYADLSVVVNSTVVFISCNNTL